MTSGVQSTHQMHSCTVCETVELNHAFNVEDFKKRSFDYFTCTSCGTLQLPNYSEELLEYAYEQDYYGCETQKFKWPFSLFFNIGKTMAARRFQKYLPINGGKVLDVGAGHGGFLTALGKLKKTVKLVGNDIHKSVLMPNDIEFKAGSFDETDFGGEDYDLITLFHVFEHLPNPTTTIEKLNGLLKPGGYLVLSIPNVSSKQFIKHGSNWFHLDPPRHLHLIPPRYLIELCQRHGLTLKASSSASIFYNPFSNIQSLLNRYFHPRDVFYEWLKVNSSQEDKYIRLKRLISAAAAVTTIPFFVLVDISRREFETATIELVFEKTSK